MDFNKKALEIITAVSGSDATKLTPDMELVGDLGIDSPHALQLLVDLEDALEIEISDEDAAKMDSVGDVLAFLAGLPQPQGA